MSAHGSNDVTFASERDFTCPNCRMAIMGRAPDGLRDYFAAAALTGMLADGDGDATESASRAYVFADAMLAARKERGT